MKTRFCARDPTPVPRGLHRREVTRPYRSVGVPAVTAFSMDSRMTAAAKGDEVLTAVVTTFRQGLDVMHLFCLHQLALLITKLTEGMLLHILVADALPSSAVASLGSRVSFITFIALGFHLGVFLTETTVS